MSFIDVQNNIVSFLGTQAGSSFTVIGYTPDSKGADKINTSKQLTIVYRHGDNPKSSNSISNDIDHHCRFRVVLTVASNAKLDLSVIDNPNSSPAQIAAAIANRQTADYLVNKAWDAFYLTVFGIIMKPENRFLGNQDFHIADRWIPSVDKGDAEFNGSTAVLTGMFYLELRCIEDLADPDLTQTLDVIDGSFSNVSIDETEIDTYTETEIKETY